MSKQATTSEGSSSSGVKFNDGKKEVLFHNLAILDQKIFDYCNDLRKLKKEGIIDSFDHKIILDKLLDVCVGCQHLVVAVESVEADKN